MGGWVSVLCHSWWPLIVHGMHMAFCGGLLLQCKWIENGYLSLHPHPPQLSNIPSCLYHPFRGFGYASTTHWSRTWRSTGAATNWFTTRTTGTTVNDFGGKRFIFLCLCFFLPQSTPLNPRQKSKKNTYIYLLWEKNFQKHTPFSELMNSVGENNFFFFCWGRKLSFNFGKSHSLITWLIKGWTGGIFVEKILIGWWNNFSPL